MKKALALTSVTLAAFALPLVSLAAVNNLSDVGSFIINTINNILVPVLFAIAFVVLVRVAWTRNGYDDRKGFVEVGE